MTYYPPVSPYAAGLGGKCPRCGQGALFDGFLKLRRGCESCGLDYAKADSGDGPAVFVIFIVGFLAVVIAFVVRYAFFAPMAVALAVSSAFTVASILLLLRPLKATLIALQYANRAADGRVDS